MDLYSITEVSFNVIKRSVRDSLNLLIDNFKQDRINERASGVNVEESELDKKIPDIIERQHEAKLVDEEIFSSNKSEIEVERANADEQRKRSMETLGENNQRKPELDEDEDLPPRKSRKTGSETIAYLREKCQQEIELRKQEIEEKKGKRNLERFS